MQRVGASRTLLFSLTAMIFDSLLPDRAPNFGRFLLKKKFSLIVVSSAEVHMKAQQKR